jgi:hypothetical protein
MNTETKCTDAGCPMESYIGTQKILQEVNLGDGFIVVTLEPTQERVAKSNPPEYVKAEGLGEKEEVVYNEADLKKIKTLFPNSDATSIRDLRCERVVSEILLSLFTHCVRNSDLEYVFQSVTSSLGRADTRRMRKITRLHEQNASVYDLRDELIG